MTHIPTFHVDAMKRLRILSISNNFLEDISGISRLDSLTELDLSGNCIVDHSNLLPLSTLVSLCYLNLLENPVACHPKHRVATVRYLHKNTSSVKFVLDNVPLTKTEKNLTGSYDHYHPVFMSRNSTSSGMNTPNRRSFVNTPSSSVGSRTSLAEHREESTSNNNSSLNVSVLQKKIKIRAAVIAEGEEIVEPKSTKTNVMEKSLGKFYRIILSLLCVCGKSHFLLET